jgi:hypothetical protein
MRAAICHCGMTRERALETTPSEAAVTEARGAPGAALPRDVRLLLGGAVLVVVLGLGWALFAPPPRPATTPVLGWIDPGPPDPAEVLARAAPPKPPFKLPWWR